MKKSTVLTTAIVASLLTIASVAHSSPEGGKRGHGKHGKITAVEKAEHMEKRLNRMAVKLNLTDEQKGQVKVLKENARNEIVPLRAEHRAIRTEIRALDVKDNAYEAKLADAANRQSEITRQMVILKGSQRKALSTVLTTEQLTKSKEMRSKRKSGKRRGKGKRDLRS